MNCQKIKKLLNSYIDDALEVEIAQQVEEHLKSCPVCNKEYQILKKIETALNSFSPKTAPADFTQNIMAKISQREIQIQSSFLDQLKKRAFIPRFSFRLLGAAAATALLVFFAFTFILNTNSPDNSSICSAEVQFSLRISDSNKVHTVAIAGDFNGWDPQANTLQDPEGDGIWTATLKLPPGRYEYMFVLDGEKWLPNPNALRYVKDGFGNRNAILEINNCNST
ncbi:MAG TPA: hypothetical protein DEG96_02615 [Candidatus Atribacteria bacterium]|nr:hypothetical protein [Candidatus Atribacteria bacterium]